MCGRFTRYCTWWQIWETYNLFPSAPNVQPRYNICPTAMIDTVISRNGKRELTPMRWGLVPTWWSKPLKDMKLATFNAGAESVAQNPMFRSAFKRGRCLIPASGYYEWEDTKDGKQPHYFTARDGRPVLTIAGLWDEWKNKETGEALKSCTMLIAAANNCVAKVHDRMPFLLAEKEFEPWLNGKAGAELLRPARNDCLQRWPVSKRVNSSRADGDDATLIDKIKLPK
jgi:putative SOS response-associated peptidase YedK